MAGLIGIAFMLWILIVLEVLSASGWAVIVATLLMSGGGGMASVALYTLAMRFAADGGQAGTDFTLLQSANVLAEILIAGAVIGLAAAVGYAAALTVNLLCLAGVLVILAWVARIKSVRDLTTTPDAVGGTPVRRPADRLNRSSCAASPRLVGASTLSRGQGATARLHTSRTMRASGTVYCHKALRKSYSELGPLRGWRSPRAPGSGSVKTLRPRKLMCL